MSSGLQKEFSQGLQACCPWLDSEVLTWTAGGNPVEAFQLGRGERRVLLTAGHHANESITSLLLWRLLEDYCRGLREDGSLYGFSCRGLFRRCTLYLVPLVNPDGADLVASGPEYRHWKANGQGVDLNLNYPARWELAKALKAQTPGPRDFPGHAPLDQPETAALAEYTRRVQPDVIAAWHTQGGEIYGDEDLFGRLLARESGYTLCQPPAESDNAGYRDWFLQEFQKPGFTIEAGRGENPLPLTDFSKIYRENLPIFALLLAGIQSGCSSSQRMADQA